jgi:acyl dehydratase
LRGSVRDSAGNPIVTLNTILRVLTMRPGRETVYRRQDVARKPLFKLDIEPVNLTQTRRYATASLDYNPLHTDVNAARAAGLPDIIVHGMMVMGQFERAIAGWRRDLRITRLNAMFLQPLPVGRPIVVNGRMVKSVRNGNDEQSILRIIVGTDLEDVVYVGEATVSESIDGTNVSPLS